MQQNSYDLLQTSMDAARDIAQRRKRKRTILIIATALMLCLAAGVAAIVLARDKGSSGKSQDAAATVPESQRSLTLYYRDGKTVLWQSVAQADTAAKPAFATYVQDQLAAKHGKDYQARGAWQVTTTLDKALQQSAIDKIQAGKDEFARHKATDAALIAQDVANGQIVSWVGGLQDGSDGEAPQWDIIRRKIVSGTLALPWTYAAYFEKTASTSETILQDTQGPLPGYSCTNRERSTSGGNCLFNFDYKYLGPLTAKKSLAGGRVVPAYKAGQEAGLQTTLETAAKLGSDGKCYAAGDATLTKEAVCYGSATIGDGIFATPQHMLQAYATLANDGEKLPQTVVLSAKLNGKAMYDWQEPAGERAISQKTARAVTSILTDAQASYLPSRYYTAYQVDGKPVAVANGVGFDATMGSTVQYTDRYAVGFWVVTNGYAQMVGSLETVTVPVASDWMKSAEEKGGL